MSAEYPVRPWWGMLHAPRATIRAIVDADPARWVWLLIALAGIQAGLLGMLDGGPDPRRPHWATILAAATGGAFQNVVAVVVFAFTIQAVAGWLGGTGTRVQTRAAIAWSSVPAVASIVLWVPAVLIGWPVFFGGEPEALSSRLLPLLLLLALAMAASLWAVVLMVLTVAEVQRLSILRSIGTLVISTGLFVLALLLLWWLALLAATAALLPKFRWSF